LVRSDLLVESLDDFAELALHVHPDRLKKLSEHLAFSSRTRAGTTTAQLYRHRVQRKHPKGGN
jgi:hypothetical protein